MPLDKSCESITLKAMEPFLYYPVKQPINPKNLFGANPNEYAPLGQKGHPGVDFEAPTGTPIYSPCDGVAFYASDSIGGDGIWIRTTDGTNNYNVILWHMPTPALNPPAGVTSTKNYPFSIPTSNFVTTPVKAGQKLGYTDNSGYHPTGVSESTGPHLHLGIMPADETWQPLNKGNGFLGCVDPQPFFNGKFAEDILEAQVIQASSNVVQLVQTATDAQVSHTDKLSVLAAIEQFLKSLIP